MIFDSVGFRFSAAMGNVTSNRLNVSSSTAIASDTSGASVASSNAIRATGGYALIDSLVRHGVSHVFGY
ncbi:MAG: hypothetical protein F6K09_23850, partial [Merismopedia sp. SIO2A8]|nr:hypothetical protein [Merismopedia sp. SIO2A8]